ncbi:MAG: hypothetical protein HY360_26995 [Verrucomicrobia bacterium]|nr:hypothetical protein [Verrucomicrobiota bacterium]
MLIYATFEQQGTYRSFCRKASPQRSEMIEVLMDVTVLPEQSVVFEIVRTYIEWRIMPDDQRATHCLWEEVPPWRDKAEFSPSPAPKSPDFRGDFGPWADISQKFCEMSRLACIFHLVKNAG